jgi:hypothetical protein
VPAIVSLPVIPPPGGRTRARSIPTCATTSNHRSTTYATGLINLDGT